MARIHSLIRPIPLFLAFLPAAVLAQEPVPLGGELAVNAATTGRQERPTVASSGDGFVVLWQDTDAGCGLALNEPCAEGRRFDSDGVALGGDFAVGAATTSAQRAPAVATTADGGFVAAWTTGIGVRARQFDSTGAPVGADLPVSLLALVSDGPDVGVDGSDGFVVTWAADGGPSSRDIRARRFDSAGATVGSVFLVNAYSTDAQLDPALAVRSDGSFVVTWVSYGCDGCDDTDGASVQAARVSAGDVNLDEFQVNVTTTGNQTDAAIAALPGDGFVIAWNDQGTAARARRFDSAGLALGMELVATTTVGPVDDVVVSAAGGSGDFVVAWTGGVEELRNDASPPAIEARAFDAAGTPLGGVFQINVAETGDQSRPALVHSGEELVAVWETSAFADPPDIGGARFEPAVPPLTFVVTKTEDTADGVCDADCSLREAVIAANANEPAADVIQVPPGTYVLTRVGSDDDANAGDLDLTDDVRIEGLLPTVRGGGEPSVVTIDGNGIDDIFDVDALDTGTVVVEMADLVITGGLSSSAGGGIDNQGTLTLTRCRVTGNQAGQDGGGIDNMGTLTLVDSTVDGNTAGVAGGGILNEGQLTLLRSTISGNSAQNGGGILHLETSIVLQAFNSTISGNSATAGSGGGLSLLGDAALVHVTVAGNNATAGATAIAIIGAETPAISVTGSIISGDCNDDDLVSNDANIESPGDTCFLTPAGGDQVGVTELALNLGALGDNGGSTQTMLPLAGSVAIDVAAADTSCPATDQRGITRPQEGDGLPPAACDVGAVEVEEELDPNIFDDDFESGDTSGWTVTVPAT